MHVHMCMCVFVYVSLRPGLLEVQLDQADISVGTVRLFIIFGFFHLSPSTFKTQPLKFSKQ